MKTIQKKLLKSRSTLLMRTLVVVAFTVFSASCSSSPCNEKKKDNNAVRLMMLKLAAHSKH